MTQTHRAARIAMPTLHLIDPSLSIVGDHHFDFARHVMGVAAERGFRVRLAVNRKFHDSAAVPEGWAVDPCFRHHAYHRHSLHHGGAALLARLGDLKLKPALKNLWTAPTRGVANAWYRQRRQVRLHRFASELAAYWASAAPQAGDQMILPTVSEFELIALARVLPTLAGADAVDWHLLFHFNIFEGPETEAPAQQALVDWMAQTVGDACRVLRQHSLSFYTSNETLNRQYQMLGVAPFQALAYPMNPQLMPAAHTPPAPPMRILVGGGVRREKGQSRLDRIAADLWADGLDCGAAQLVVQSGKLGFSVTLPGRPAAGIQPVVYPPHPLPMAAYRDLIADAHVGLFLYDRRRYYARRSGVLTDCLCAGLPVIVPAGCWLAEQVQPSIDVHARRVLAEHPDRQLLAPEHISSDGGEWIDCSANASPAIRLLMRTVKAGCVAVSFDWPASAVGTQVMVELSTFNAAGESLGVMRSCVGRPDSAEVAIAVFSLTPAVHSLRLSWKNAFDSAALRFRLREVAFVSADAKPLPLGSFGLIAADDEQIGRLVREVLAHHAHYRSQARAFAEGWRRRHHPARTLEQFLASAITAVRR